MLKKEPRFARLCYRPRGNGHTVCFHIWTTFHCIKVHVIISAFSRTVFQERLRPQSRGSPRSASTKKSCLIDRRHKETCPARFCRSVLAAVLLDAFQHYNAYALKTGASSSDCKRYLQSSFSLVSQALAESRVQDSSVRTFLAYIDRYCRSHYLVTPIEFPPDHPVEEVSHFLQIQTRHRTFSSCKKTSVYSSPCHQKILTQKSDRLAKQKQKQNKKE